MLSFEIISYALAVIVHMKSMNNQYLYDQKQHPHKYTDTHKVLMIMYLYLDRAVCTNGCLKYNYSTHTHTNRFKESITSGAQTH